MNRTGREKQHRENCMICGAPLVYVDAAEMRECAICHRMFSANASCQAGHFVCDEFGQSELRTHRIRPPTFCVR